VAESLLGIIGDVGRGDIGRGDETGDLSAMLCSDRGFLEYFSCSSEIESILACDPALLRGLWTCKSDGL
jgi:hypothetical protein